jgi:hypothetical protein
MNHQSMLVRRVEVRPQRMRLADNHQQVLEE